MLLLCILCTVNICAVDGRRLKYMMDSLDTHQGLPHYIKRSSIFDDAVTSTRMSFRIFFMSIRFESTMLKKEQSILEESAGIFCLFLGVGLFQIL